MTIKELEAPCWIVQDGYPSGDGSHFATEAEARTTGLDAYRRDGTPCWLALCACGKQLGFSDDYDEIHYRTAAEAEAASEAADGRCVLCEDEAGAA